jgi:Fe-S-cluster containining protein
MNEYKCVKCGKCCRQFTLPAQNKEELMKFFEEQFGFTLIDPEIKVLFSGACEHLKDNKCKVYKCRPKRCQGYFCKKYPASDAW